MVGLTTEVSVSSDHQRRASVSSDVELPRAPPHRMGRYVILRLLGVGGMGEVYEAYDPELARRVAIKVVQTRSGSHVQPDRRQRDRARLVREAKSLARLSHPNIVPIYDVGILDDQSIFVAMEFVAGLSLREKMADGCEHWREHLDIALQAGLGLAAAHDAGLVHRDVKPENIMVGSDGRVCLLDFGLAKGEQDGRPKPTNGSEQPDGLRVPAAWAERLNFAERTSANEPVHITRSGSVVGTPGYLAPEQLDGHSGQIASDVFAWSCVVFEVICGQPPFPSQPINARLQAIHHQRLSWPPTVPSWLREIVQKGLRERPSERFANIRWMHRAIAQGLARNRRRRHLRVGAIWGSLALVALVLPFWPSHPAKSRECAELERTASAVWNRDISEAVQLAFEGQAIDPASALWQKIDQGLDAWQAVWLESASKLCQAPLAGNEALPLATREAGRACLIESQAEVEALIGIWGQPTIEQILSAANAVQSLSDPQRCIDTESLQHRARLPLDAKARQEVLRLRAEITAIKIRVAQADYDQAQHLLQQINLAVRAAHDPELWSEYLEVRAKYQRATSQGKDRALAQEAALLAAIAADRAEPAAFFANERFYTRTYALNQAETGESFLADAAALTQRAQSHPREQMMLSRNRGIWQAMQGRDQAARTEFERALMFAQQGWGATSEQAAFAHDTLGILAENTSDPENSLRHHQHASVLRSALFGRSHPLTLRSQQGVATALEDSDRLLESTVLRAQILQICIDTGYSHALCGACWDGLGQSQAKRGDFLSATATKLAEIEWQALAGQRSEPTAPWAESKLSLIYERRGQWLSALQLAITGLDKLAAEGQFHPFTYLAAHEQMAWATLRVGLPNRAAYHLAELQRNINDDGESQKIHHFRAMILQAEIDLVSGSNGQARTGFATAIAWSDHSSLSLEARAQAADGLARSLLAVGQFQAAQAAAEQALASIEAIDGILPHVSAPYHTTLAQSLIGQKNWDEALVQLDLATHLFDPVQVLDNRLAPIEFAQAQARWHLAIHGEERVAARRLALSALAHYRDWDAGAKVAIAGVEKWLEEHRVGR